MSKEANSTFRALKLALEALEAHADIGIKSDKAITALQEALAEQPAPAQEPVAHCEAGPEFCPVCHAETRSLALAAAIGYIQRNTPPLVSNEICNALKKPSPAQRTWVGLTDEEIEKLTVELRDIPVTLAFAIEAKLRSKNEDRN